MRTTITIDDDLFEKASAIVGDTSASSLLSKALEMMVAADSKKRLLKLSGGMPNFEIPERNVRDVSLCAVAEEPSAYNA